MRTFNRLAIAAGVILGSSVLYASSAMAADVTISGSVTSQASVTLTNGNQALVLGGTGTGTGLTDHIEKAADVSLFTNNTGGLELTITSGNLTNGTPGSSTIAYQVVTTADTLTPASGDFTQASSTDKKESITTGFTNGALERDLHVMYTTPELLDPGIYTATITVTVADL